MNMFFITMYQYWFVAKMCKLTNYGDATWDSYDVIGMSFLFSILSSIINDVIGIWVCAHIRSQNVCQ